MVETRFEFRYYVTQGEVRAELEGLEVMKLQLNSANLTQAIQSNIIAADPEIFLRVADEEQRQRIYDGVKARFAQVGFEVTDEVLRQNEAEALRKMGHDLIRESVEAAVKQIEEQLPRIMEMVNDKVLGAAFFSGANKLREIAEQPKGKYTAREIKDAIFEKDWKLIKPLIGMQTGGPRNIKHVWTDEDRKCLTENYERLKPVWLEAKRIAKAAQNAAESSRRQRWAEAVAATYPELDADLINRLAPDSSDARPADIALTHAARICIPNVSLTVRKLRQEIGIWKSKVSS